MKDSGPFRTSSMSPVVDIVVDTVGIKIEGIGTLRNHVVKGD